MIQILTYTGEETKFQGKEIEVNSFHNARSLDEFDINIIILEDAEIWYYHGEDAYSINNIDDIKSLSIMIMNSKRTKNIIVIPQNKYYYFDYGYQDCGYRYRNSKELKDMIPCFCKIISVLFEPMAMLNIAYENTYTIINGEEVTASFYFDTGIDILLESDKSNKATTIKLGQIILTSLYLKDYYQITNFLKEINLIHDRQDVPEWMKEIKMFDDNEQLAIIEQNNQTINAATENISIATAKLDENNKFKSILYTYGDELVNVVFKILETMLGCDLSQFEDKKNEDFLFEKDGYVFIGEIKGVNHNVKSDNVAQLERHYQGYLDEHEDRSEDSIKAILIMNHQKNKPIEQREPVHERQINLAKRNGSLIIETITFLKLFEKFLTGNISREDCLDLLKSEEGLLQI